MPTVNKEYKGGQMHNAKKPKPIVKMAGGVAIRTCLSCGKEFMSCWIGNRMCDVCTEMAGRRYHEESY